MMKWLYLSTLLVVNTVQADIRPQSADTGTVRWQEKGNRSDSFNSSNLDTKKWDNAPKSLNVGAWSFAQNNAFVKDGLLNIVATQETHTRPFKDVCLNGATVQRELFYKSGAVRTKADGVYGYYEARMKGVKIFPGLSPAFWLYSDGHPFPDSKVEGSVDYSEIDIVELQQADWHGPGKNDADPINVMDHNLHARIMGKNNKKIWKRPKPNPESQLLRYEADFDPSEDFHTYAVENRKDTIFWYVDGKLIGQKPNLYWHRPMHVIFSMGLRRQFIKYNAKCQRADPNLAQATTSFAPEDTTMQVDYVKVWEALPSLWVDDKKSIQTKTYTLNKPLNIKLNYHGGSNSYVVSNKGKGLTLSLIEKNEKGFVRNITQAFDNTVVSEKLKYGGHSIFSLPLNKVPLTETLPKGHYYSLVASFKSSTGANVFLNGGISHINIVQ